MLSELISDLRYRMRAIFRRADVERELEEEVRFHLERETEKNARRGLGAGEAERRARIDFGGVDRIKEDARDARGVRPLEVVARDLRYAARGLRAHPGFTLAVVATLALGIGANTAMFGIVDRLLFRSPAFMIDASRVNRVNLIYTFRGKPNITSSIEYRRYLDLASGSNSFSELAAFHNTRIAVGTGENAQEMRVAMVSASYFRMFSAKAEVGRFFDSTEDAVPLGAPVVVISHALWVTKFGERTDVVGQPLQVGSLAATIIGVAPRDFVGVEWVEPVAAFMPLTSYAHGAFPDYYQNYNWGWLQVIARRKSTASVAEATDDLSRAYLRSWESERAMQPHLATIAQAHPHAMLSPIQNLRGPDSGRDAPMVPLVGGIAGIVMLIAVANVINLLLGRVFRRRREIAVRLALGVTRRRLIAQLLAESVLLASIAGIAGMAIGEVTQSALRRSFLPSVEAVGVFNDARSILFACVIALSTGLLTGLVPALQSTKADLNATLKAGVREGGPQRSRMRTTLLIAQGALSVFLLVGAGLFVRSLNNVISIHLGYDVDPLLYVSTNLRGTHLSKAEIRRLKDQLESAALSIAGVESSAQALTVPLWESRSESFSTPGIDSAERLGHFTMQMGTFDYFRTMGTRIVRGRGFDSTDRRGSPRVLIVSEGMAKLLWPGQNPLGKCIRFADDSIPCTIVIGVAENIKATDIAGEETLQYYRSIEQNSGEDAAIFIRTSGKARAHALAIRKQLQTIMPGESYLTVTPMEEVVGPALSSWRIGATMFLLFGSLALVLAAIGLYSVIAYDVAQRTQELGLRIALGAHALDVVRMIIGEGLRFGLLGIVIGALIALAAGHWVQPLLYGESAHDPLVFVAVASVLSIVAIAASAIPARRAMRLDPSIALRTE